VALRPRLATGLPFSRTVIPLPGMAYNTDMRRGRAINTSGSNHDAAWPYYEQCELVLFCVLARHQDFAVDLPYHRSWVATLSARSSAFPAP
jgi:hypothetical protein